MTELLAEQVALQARLVAGCRACHAEEDAAIAMEAERDAYRSMLRDVLASAYPNERDHPAMSKAWKAARELLKNGPQPTAIDPEVG